MPYTPVRFWYSMLFLTIVIVGEIIFHYMSVNSTITTGDIEYHRELILQLAINPNDRFIIVYDDSLTFKPIRATFKFLLRLIFYEFVMFVIYFVKNLTELLLWDYDEAYGSSR